VIACEPGAAAASARPAHPGRPAMQVLHDSDDVRLLVFRIAPGQAVPVHRSSSSVVLQVLSGSGVVQHAEGEFPVSAGAVLVYAPGEPHGMRAIGEELTLLATVAPRPSSR
jgi:quercetin dioxygenase-like cupin family protein